MNPKQINQKRNRLFLGTIAVLLVTILATFTIPWIANSANAENANELSEESTTVEVNNAAEHSTTATVPEEPCQDPVNIPSGDNQNENPVVMFIVRFVAEEGGSVSRSEISCDNFEVNHYILYFDSDNVVRATYPTEGWNIKEVTPTPNAGYKFDAWYDSAGNKIEPKTEKGYSVSTTLTAKFVEKEPALVPIHVACDEQYLSDADIYNLVNKYDWTYNKETKTWSNEFLDTTTYASAMESWKNVKPEKDGYNFKGFSPEPDDQHFLTQETTFNPIFEKSTKGKTITFITGDFKEAWGDKIMAVFYNEEGVTEQQEMATTEPGIFLVEIGKDESTSVRFNSDGPINKDIDAGRIPNVENPTFILTSEDEGEWYKEPDPPKPDPSSDQSSDASSISATSNVSASAQTGDNSPIALFAFFAIACGAFVLKRKFN